MGGTDSVLLAGPKSVTAALATRIDAESDSFTVETVTDEQAAIEAFESGAHDCVVATDQVASGSGLDLLEAVRARWETVPTVLVATEGSAVVASDAVTAARTVASLADAGAEIARQVEAVLPDRSRPGSETGSRSDYRHLFEEMNEGMAVHKLLTDAHGEPVDYRILRVNQQYERILGLERHDVEGKRASNVYKTEAPPFLKQFARVVETGESTQFETFYEPIEKHLEISAFRPESGLFATVFSDVTERKQAKQDCRGRGNMWFIPYETVRSSKDHPAAFPPRLAEMCIRLHGAEEQPLVVMDPFMGSGSTAIAAKQCGCAYVGFEMDEDYVSLTRQKLSQGRLNRPAE